MSYAETHRADEAVIDERSCHATGTVQWLLEGAHKAGTHPITSNNLIKVFIGGQDGFAAIADDLGKANSSVDLVCWGFDPGMELRRNGSEWPRGPTFGELLRALATRREHPVKVRLLIWYSYLGGQVQHHMPGYTDAVIFNTTSAEDHAFFPDPAGLGIAPLRDDDSTPLTRRADYCVLWWRWALNKKNAQLIEVRMRDGDKGANQRALATDPATKPSSSGIVDERSLLEGAGTHHQKTVLIDYQHANGSGAVGYVMGLNSTTGYWDTTKHEFNDKWREYDESGETETFARLRKAGGPAARVRRDPFHDYACRIQGQALQRVNDNFFDGWVRAGGSGASKAVPAALATIRFFDQTSRVQIVRTQPTDQDQTIRDCYWQATSFARNYLYVENQYFQYEEWASHLKTSRAQFRTWFQQAGHPNDKSGVLHCFIIVPRPEKKQMQPRTFDTFKSLGRSDQMQDVDDDGKKGGQYVEMQKQQDAMSRWQKDMDEWQRLSGPHSPRPGDPLLPGAPPRKPRSVEVFDSAAAISEPNAKDLEAMGLKVLIGMLVSYDDGGSGLELTNPRFKYRQVYIHSKLLVIDDAFFTLGSANLNQRSMLTDSEINIATDDHAKAADLRQRAWWLHTGGTADGGGGDAATIADTFRAWKKLMVKNDDAKKNGRPLIGFLCSFGDHKFSYERYA